MTAELQSFQVIHGGRDATVSLDGPVMMTQATPELSAAELAADMAELYAMSLLRDVPLAHLSDPHHTIRLPGGSQFTLHELLCELRSLTWFDCRAVPSPRDAIAAFSRAGQGEAGHRRSLRWNDDGQLTLRALFRGGVAHQDSGAPISDLWLRGLPKPATALESAAPAATARLSDWITWLQHGVGADFPLPGYDAAPRQPVRNLRDLAEQVLTAHPGQAFFTTALGLLAQGVPLQAGLQDTPALKRAWTSQRLLALMARACDRATEVAQQRFSREDRLSRPVVTAARFAVMHSRDDLQTGPHGGALREAIDELGFACPNLLAWVSRFNGATSSHDRFRNSLMLPVFFGPNGPLHSQDGAAHALAAGALTTLLKAVFALNETPRAGAPTAANNQLSARSLDRIAGDIGLARSVAGAFYAAETQVDLRLGEALGLDILREALEVDNLPTTLSFPGLDGDSLSVAANPGTFGQAHVTLQRNAKVSGWLGDQRRTRAHLTAVV